MIEAFSAAERSALIAKYSRATEDYKSLMEAGDYDAAENQLRLSRQLEAEYFEQIPYIMICPCPFDGKPLFHSFDPFGLDGIWWRSDATPPEIPTCSHFCVLLGAVNFSDLTPQAGDFEVHPGPEVPYVVPKLLEHEGMIAVISQLEMDNGYIAYPISYFAEKRPPPQELTAGWARTIFVYATQLGISGWRIPNDTWNFDLMPWLKAGKIRWCPPESDNSALSEESPDTCPYIDLPGRRENIVVKSDSSWSIAIPDGQHMSPFD